ncbi:PadR family transcriptional regulator [Acidicapsa ligni]|uniref:PadR family transcriptional regulator n=1 Tax=Acidicapsa ligni TaxID=542300 RepID=UPI0021E034C3|nr:PadR family transcriptional regulator [Acidicapsa ligni]
MDKAKLDKAKLDLVRGTLDVLILKALAWGPLHGYAITSLILRQSDEALLVEEGTLYPALWRLESKALLAAEWGLSENNRKAKFYRLTTSGRRQLRQETKTWEAYALAVAKVLNATQPPIVDEAV